MNPLDHKPFKNDFAGKSAKTKQHFKPNSNLSGYGKGTDVTSKTNKLSLPVTRTGSSTGKLVKRTYTDVAPGLQGGLRETAKILEEINEFCTSDLQEMGFRGTAKDNFEAPEPRRPTEDPFYSLITRVRHARKTGDKAKEVQAQDELHRLATRHNRMKDPEVLDALSESEEVLSDIEQFSPENQSKWPVDHPFSKAYFKGLRNHPYADLITSNPKGREGRAHFNATKKEFQARV